jgi:hypothetical protein
MRAVVDGSDERRAVDAETRMVERRILVVSFGLGVVDLGADEQVVARVC